MEITELSERPDLLQRGIEFFWRCWGNDANYNFYEDCILHSLDPEKALPKFYLGLEGDTIVGTYALITNDLNSRQDLLPWLACLYVIEGKRNLGYAARLLEHGVQQAALKGFDTVYLSTDLEDFYEKKGWLFVGTGYGFSGSTDKIYSRGTGLLGI